MSNAGRLNKRPLLQGPSSSDHEIGYGKPPLQTRFKPGQSGNPRGRPKGAKNKLPALNEERLKGIILEEAYRTIKVRDGEKHISIPMAKAIVRSLALSAAKGSNRATQLFTALVQTTERENKALHDQWLDVALTYKVEWERELDRRKRLNIVAPDPIPHPDDIDIDMNTGQIKQIGPWTKEEKVKWDMFRERKKECDISIAAHEEDLRRHPRSRYKKQILDDIAFERHIRSIICRLIPD